MYICMISYMFPGHFNLFRYFSYNYLYFKGYTSLYFLEFEDLKFNFCIND